jgi:Rps23 Pro-64 3,4-dihydroxylase Tpa1-like proline 4-hydroxylase
MQKFKNFLSSKLYDKLNNIISLIDVDDLETIFDRSYEKKSTDFFECLPLRVHTGSSISYKEFFICKSILDEFRFQIKKNLNTYESKHITFQVCIWERESFLKMHFDSIYKYGGTLYLNDTWEESWGGLFEYKANNGKIKTICPEKNLFLFDDNNELHGVTMINKKSPQKRKSIQVWMFD